MPMKGVVKNVRLDDRTVHPAIRFDTFLNRNEATFQTTKKDVKDSYVRTFPLYGSMRPSPAFTTIARVNKFEGVAVDMSNLPPTWNDMRGDTREGSYSYNVTSPADPEFFKILGNQSLMLPSERREEAKRFKDGWDDFQKSRTEHAEYTKRRRTLTRHHKSGIVGIDGPMKADSELYEADAARVKMQAEVKEAHDLGRKHHLGRQFRSSDAVALRGWSEPPSMDAHATVPLQRKNIDPEKHPFRFLNTHERLFPAFVPTFDPERAKILHHHQVRERKHDILHQGSNRVHGIRQRIVDDLVQTRPDAKSLGEGIGWRTD